MGTPTHKAPKKKNLWTEDLIAFFVDGYAEGWFMAVGEQFKNELSIKFTKRVAGDTWLQGPYYCFDEGHVFYDSPHGYSQWSDALKKINLACKIIEAKPNSLSVDELVDSKRTMNKGYVKFSLYEPNFEKTALIKINEHVLSQDDFVYFLKTGEIIDTSSNQIDIEA